MYLNYALYECIHSVTNKLLQVHLKKNNYYNKTNIQNAKSELNQVICV